MMEVAEFVAKNYYHDDTLPRVERVRNLLSYPGVFFAGLPDDGLILIYITLSDEGLEILRSATTEEAFKNGFSERLLQYPGDHIYVFRLVSDGKPKLDELRRLRSRIIKKHNARSFSWHDNDRVILHTYEVA